MTPMPPTRPVQVRGATQAELTAHVFWPVIQHAFNGLEAVNPSRVDALVEHLDGAVPVLVVSDAWVCRYHLATGEIRISTAVVEAMWAAAYAYYLLYKASEGTRGGDLPPFLQGEVLQRALEVYRWALSRAGGQPRPWPAHFPTPRDPALGQVTPEGVASEMALVAVAALLLHEIAHHALHHDAEGEQADSIQMERDADNFALDWMIDGKGENEKAREKMRVGVTMAFGWMVAAEAIAWRRGTLRTLDDEDVRNRRVHPWSYARLFDLLERSGADDHATSWCLAVAVLALHANHVELAVPKGRFDSCRDAANALVDVLAEHIR